MGMAGIAKYNRMPTRHKLQLTWIFLFGVGLTWEYLKLTVYRVNPKREEELYLRLETKYPDGKLPPKLQKEIESLREFRDTVSMHQALNTPTPGEVSGALQHDLDVRHLGQLRR